eukprot:m.335475 g.335475  ORF g.335475 m.335475 type:complete len:491 (-) comp17604_c0_seq1:79-1551(-)
MARSSINLVAAAFCISMHMPLTLANCPPGYIYNSVKKDCENVCGTGTTFDTTTNKCVVETRARRQEPLPSLKTEAGDIIFAVEDGKNVGYKIGDDIVYFKDLPMQLKDSADASVYSMVLGYNLGQGASRTSDLLDYMKDVLTKRVENVESAQNSFDQKAKDLDDSVDTKLTSLEGTLSKEIDSVEEAMNSFKVDVSKNLTFAASQEDGKRKELSNFLQGYINKRFECLELGQSFNEDTSKCCEIIKEYDSESKKCVPRTGFDKTRPAPSCKDIVEATKARTSNNKYWIDANGGSADDAIEALCDMTTDGGGWTLVSSNSAKDATFPRGTARCGYFLERAGFNDGSRASIDKDYLIGPQINSMKYKEGRVMTAGGIYVIDIKWPQTSHRVALRSNRATATFIGSNNILDLGCGNCHHLNLDAQRTEGTCNSNSNQRTIGGVCTNSSPDPSSGTYLGHGSNEGAHPGEGNIFSPPGGSCRSQDFTTYTTWVR